MSKECPCCEKKGWYYADTIHASTFFCDNDKCRVASYDTVPVVSNE